MNDCFSLPIIINDYTGYHFRMAPHTGDPETESLLTGYTGQLSLVVAIGWLATQLGRQVVPPLLPAVIDQLGITPGKAGIAITISWIAYALVHYPAGRLSDQLSRKTLLVFGLAVSVTGLIALVNALLFTVFLIGVAFLGAGAGIYYIVSRALLSDLFIEKRGQAFGLNQAAGSTGSVLAAGVAAAALAVATWQAAFLPAVIILCVVLLVVHFQSREPYIVEWVDFEFRDSGTRVFEIWEIRWIIVVYSLYTFSINGVASFLPTFLQVNKGFSPTVASGGFALIYITGILVAPLAGNLADHRNRLGIAMISLLVAVLGLVSLVAVPPSVFLMAIVVIVFATGMRAYAPTMQAYLMDVFPPEKLGGDFGFFRTIYIVAGSLGPTYVGIVAERLDYSTAFFGIAVLLVFCTLILGVLFSIR